MTRLTHGRHLGRFFLFAAILLGMAGCSDSGATVSGEVTFEGKPLEKGYISFLPVDGKGQARSSAIVDGKFLVDKIGPGEKIVSVISSTEEAPSIRTDADRAAMSPEMKARYNPKTGIISSEIIPVNAVGNNQKVTVESGNHVMNFAITVPPKP